MTAFLSDAWFDKVAELTAAAGDLTRVQRSAFVETHDILTIRSLMTESVRSAHLVCRR